VSVLSTVPIGKGNLTFVNSGTNDLESTPLDGSPLATLTGNFVYCGFGGSASDFPASVRGKIALIQRGNNVHFSVKARNANAAGATAVVIFNNVADGPMNWTMLGDNVDDNTYKWPLAVGLSLADGQALQQNPNATITLANIADDYEVLSGTSMATPHVAGAAALVWSASPNASATDVKQALTMTARDLGAKGQDPSFGFGLIDAYNATKLLAPQYFGSGAMGSGHSTTGRRILKRPGH
jgi:subtilisin family serine protease